MDDNERGHDPTNGNQDVNPASSKKLASNQVQAIVIAILVVVLLSVFFYFLFIKSIESSYSAVNDYLTENKRLEKSSDPADCQIIVDNVEKAKKYGGNAGTPVLLTLIGIVVSAAGIFLKSFTENGKSWYSNALGRLLLVSSLVLLVFPFWHIYKYVMINAVIPDIQSMSVTPDRMLNEYKIEIKSSPAEPIPEIEVSQEPEDELPVYFIENLDNPLLADPYLPDAHDDLDGLIDDIISAVKAFEGVPPGCIDEGYYDAMVLEAGKYGKTYLNYDEESLFMVQEISVYTLRPFCERFDALTNDINRRGVADTNGKETSLNRRTNGTSYRSRGFEHSKTLDNAAITDWEMSAKWLLASICTAEKEGSIEKIYDIGGILDSTIKTYNDLFESELNASPEHKDRAKQIMLALQSIKENKLL